MLLLYSLAALPWFLVTFVLGLALLAFVSVRNELRAIGRRTCSKCGASLGKRAVRAAEAERRVTLMEIHRRAATRGVKLRVVAPPLRVKCEACGNVDEFKL